jgi:hypothetical protein
LVFVDDQGKWRLGDSLFDGFMPFSEGRAWINLGGSRAFRPEEMHSDWIRGGAVGGKWGLIDETGRFLVEPRYEYAFSYQEGRGWANVGGRGYAVHGWTSFQIEGGKWALLDLDGREILPPTFTRPHRFSNGRAWVKLEQWGLIDKQGLWLIAPRFDQVSWGNRFTDGVEPVAMGERWGLIDVAGNWILEPRFDYIDDFKNGLAKVANWLDDPDPQDQVARTGVWGVIDTRGVLLEPLRRR